MADEFDQAVEGYFARLSERSENQRQKLVAVRVAAMSDDDEAFGSLIDDELTRLRSALDGYGNQSTDEG